MDIINKNGRRGIIAVKIRSKRHYSHTNNMRERIVKYDNRRGNPKEGTVKYCNLRDITQERTADYTVQP